MVGELNWWEFKYNSTVASRFIDGFSYSSHRLLSARPSCGVDVFQPLPTEKNPKFIIIFISMNPAIHTSLDLYSHPVICKFKQASLIPSPATTKWKSIFLHPE